MAIPRHEQIVEALRALFLTIEGDHGETFWYTPDVAIEFADWAAQCVNTPHEVVYCISPGDSDVREQTFEATEVTAEFKISMARRFDDAGEDPFDDRVRENRQQIQSRLIHDATKVLNTAGNWTLNGLALRGRIVMEVRNPEETFWKGWAIAHLMIQVVYWYKDDEP